MTDETDTERARWARLENQARLAIGNLSPEVWEHIQSAIRADHEAKLARRDETHVYRSREGFDRLRAALVAAQDQLAARDEVIAELRARPEKACPGCACTLVAERIGPGWRYPACTCCHPHEVGATDQPCYRAFQDERAAHEQTKRELQALRDEGAVMGALKIAALRTERDTLKAECHSERVLRRMSEELRASAKRELDTIAAERDTLRAERDEARKDYDYALGVEVRMAGQAVASQSELEARIATLTAERDAALKVPGEIVAWLRVEMDAKLVDRDLLHGGARFALGAVSDAIEKRWCAAEAETKEG